MTRIASVCSLALMALGCQPAPVYEPAPAPWSSAPDTPAPPSDASAPETRVWWTMNHDLRTFGETWRWLHEEVPASPRRDLAVGEAALLGVAELSRMDVADEGIAALERAAVAFPDDARVPLWRAYLIWLRAHAEGQPDDVTQAYTLLRETSVEYPAFTLFGLTMAVAGDRHADAALVDEAAAAYARVPGHTADMQYRGDARVLRLGDSATAPYSVPGTSALMGDMAARQGDLETARRHYFTALRANESYRWPFREIVQERLDDLEAVSARLIAGTEPTLGAGWRGARGVDDERALQGYDGRIGNGTCTICHTRVARESLADAPEIGWIRFTYEVPDEAGIPFPIFVALDGSDGPPGAFAIGPADVAGLTQPDERGLREGLIAVEEGSWFVAGNLAATEEGPFADVSHAAFAGDGLGMPRYVTVQPGEIADITESPLRFTRE